MQRIRIAVPAGIGRLVHYDPPAEVHEAEGCNARR